MTLLIVSEDLPAKRGLRNKVQQEAHLDFGRFQIVHQLCFMGLAQRLSALEFDDDQAFNYEIGIVVANLSAQVIDFDWPLSSDAKTHVLQLKSEGVLINLLQKAIAQLVIDIVERLDDLSGQILMLQSHKLIRANPSNRRHPWSISFRAYPCEFRFEPIRANPSNPRHPWSISFRAFANASFTRSGEVPPNALLSASDDSRLKEAYRSSPNSAENL